MGATIKTLLNQGEHVLFETKLTRLEYAWPAILLVCSIIFCLFLFYNSFAAGSYNSILLPLGVCGCIILFFLVWLFVIWIKRYSTEIAVTNLRVISKTGIISRDIFEMRLEKVESIDLFQSVMGRIFNYGTVVVHGTGDTAKRLANIEQPLKFKLTITEAAHKLRP